MGGIFGVASKKSCVSDLFFGTDYHSHLGTRRGGMAVYDKSHGFDRAIHNIQNSPFRTKFERDVEELEGTLGIGCISDSDPQTSDGSVSLGKLCHYYRRKNQQHGSACKTFLRKRLYTFSGNRGGNMNATEMVASLINQKPTLVEGNPLRAGNDRRFHDNADHDPGRYLCRQRPYGTILLLSFLVRKRMLLSCFF